MGLAHWSLVSPCHSFSFLFLFRLIPWSTGALCVHFPAWASKTHSRRSLRWGTFSYSRGCLWPTWTEQVPCWGFIGFLHKTRNISLFSLLYFLIEQKWWEGSLCVCIHVLSFTTKNKERTSKRPQAIQKSWKVIGKETEKAKILCFIMGQRKMCHCNFY